MDLKTTVIVGNVTNLSDARYCAGMGVQYLGFNIDASNPNYVNPEFFKELSGWVEGIKFLGETEYPEAAQPQEYALDGITVLNSSYQSDSLPVSNYLSGSESEVLSQLSTTDAEKVILKIEGTDSISDTIKSEIATKGNDTEIFLAYGFNSNNIQEVINYEGVSGIYLQGESEDRPGQKDYDALADILEQLESEEYL